MQKFRFTQRGRGCCPPHGAGTGPRGVAAAGRGGFVALPPHRAVRWGGVFSLSKCVTPGSRAVELSGWWGQRSTQSICTEMVLQHAGEVEYFFQSQK